MPLKTQQREDLQEAARTLVVIGWFGGVSGVHLFDKSNLTEQQFFDAVQPSLSRQYVPRFIGRHLRQAVKLAAPLDAAPGTLQRIQPNSPLLQTSQDTLRAQGEQQFAELLTQLDVCALFQHPSFSSDLLALALAFMGRHIAEADTHALTEYLAQPRVRSAVQHFLLCPTDDENAARLAVAELFSQGHTVLGSDVAAKVPDALVDCKFVLAVQDDVKDVFSKITDKDASCPGLADSCPYTGIPGLAERLPDAARNFRSSYRLFKRKSDELHACCRSPELWSYLFWWLGALAGELPEDGNVTAASPGVARLYELCVTRQAEPIPAVGEKSKELRDCGANQVLVAFGASLAKEVREHHIRQAKAILDEQRRWFDPNRPTEREDIEAKTANLYKGLAFLVDKEFKAQFAKFQVRFQNQARVSHAILRQTTATRPEEFHKALADLAAKLEQETATAEKETAATEKETAQTIRQFLASASFKALQPGKDLRIQCDAAFYTHLARITLEEFETWAKANEAKNLESAQRIEQFFRLLYLGQGGAGRAEQAGLPTTVQLDLSRLDELIHEINSQLERRGKQKPNEISVTVQAPAHVLEALQSNTNGTVRAGDSTCGQWALAAGDALTVRLDAGIHPAQLKNTRLCGNAGAPLPAAESVPTPNGGNADRSHKGDAADVPVVPLVDLGSVDAAVNGAITDKVQPREQAGRPEELTKNDLEYWYDLLRSAHTEYVSGHADAATSLIVRSYRAAVFGRYLLASPDSSTPFGKENIGNMMGLLMDMVQHLGELDSHGHLKLPGGRADRDALLQKINVTQFYPVENAGGLSVVFKDHYEVLRNTSAVQGYLREVRAVGKLIGAAQGSSLKIVVLNRTLGEEITDDNADNNILTQHPCRVVYLTHQNRPSDLPNAWERLQHGFGNEPARRLQLPVFVSADPARLEFDEELYPCVVPKEDRLPGAEDCDDLPPGGEWLALAWSMTAAAAKSGYGTLKRNLGMTRRNELKGQQGVLLDFRAGQNLVEALREGLSPPPRRGERTPHRFVQPLVWSRLLTKGLFEHQNRGGNFPVNLSQSFDATWREDMKALFHGLALADGLTPIFNGRAPEAQHAALNTIAFNMDGGSGFIAWNVVIPKYALALQAKANGPATQVLS